MWIFGYLPSAKSNSILPWVIHVCAHICILRQHFASAERIALLPSPTHFQPCDRSRKVFTEAYGEISDGPAGFNYTQDSHCEWLIKARNASQFITLTFHSMGTECSYDYIYVYDGDTFNATLLGSFSGRTEPQRLVASSGNMLILLYSDTNYVLDGFRASYYISNCLNNCHNHGKCVGHQCVCHGEWVGPDCKDEACPDKCGELFGRGKCINGMCKCEQGYTGKLCDLFVNPNGSNWRWLAADSDGMTPRAAHTSVYVEEQDSLYVFGGYDLNHVLDSLQIYRFNTSQWEDEWGIPLHNRHHFYQPQKIDRTLLQAVLSNRNEDEAKLWGLNSNVSFFTNVLHTLAKSNLNQRRTRSYNNETEKHLSSVFEDILENVTDNKPLARYGHAADNVPDGFVIFGGKLENGSFCNDLWFYNTTESGGKWRLMAKNSILKPPAVARHSINRAGEFLYLFGGTLETGDFSSRIFRIKVPTLDDENNEQWLEINPRGGKTLDVRLAAHSTVYYQHSNSLIVFGGIMTSLARFSKLSDRIYSFQLDKFHWTEILYPKTALRDTNIPRERAFHTATISGNHMIVFGGYTHRHNKEEICYDNQMYWYHLSCHIWINQEVSNDKRPYPKKQGVFAHAASLRLNNSLLIVGGYHGNVNADLFAYELPQVLRVQNDIYNPEKSCRLHVSHTACLSDPECGWCSADSSCYGRTIGANCTTNLQITRCPGICPSLGDCHSCLVHGTQWSSSTSYFSVASKLGLNECTWCVQNARCHHRDDNYGVCGEDTPSHTPGWWGDKGTEILSPEQCTNHDRRPGLTYIKYHYPVNLTMPDFVSIVNATMVDFASPTPTTQMEHQFSGEMLARLTGFVRPPKNWDQTEFQICTSYSSSVLRAGLGTTLDELDDISNQTTTQSFCKSVKTPSMDLPFLIDFQARRKIGAGSVYNTYQKSQMELQHSSHGNLKAFTFEYLEPYFFGECEKYTNCLECLTDAACGWCDLNTKCFSRAINETKECAISSENSSSWKYLITQPGQCNNCSNYISCEECIDTKLCEWWAEDARCSRLGKSPTGIQEISQCPMPCRLRNSCSECLNDRGRCVWCEANSQCFSFAVYTSEYQFGMCREWMDQSIVPISGAFETPSPLASNSIGKPKPQQQCKSCSQHTNCSGCLKTLNCGWCFDRDNPIEGVCMQGDFSRPFGNCSVMLNTTSYEEAEWAYSQCPDVDECGLGLHDCHKEAKCTNTHGSFSCHCRRGYIGDGRLSCIRTCYESCSHGHCSGSPDYVCKCDLGWTGDDCSVNCGCNNHSTCNERIGKCDQCQAWTEGERCERCRPGSYGNATSLEGCHPCECNGHGNQDRGICDAHNGECFCKDNTDGFKCDVCNKNYYGDPRDGGQCYFQCESRGILKSAGKHGIGSYQSYKSPWGGAEVRECLWLVSPEPTVAESDTIIQMEFEWSSLVMNCDENAVYIYDSLPDLTGTSQQRQLVGIVCNPYTSQRIIEAHSGHLTVHYKQGGENFGFNALYNVKNCGARTCLDPHVCDDNGKCTCPLGYVGSKCELRICPNNCNADSGKGFCDSHYGRCLCSANYGGPDCGVVIKSNLLQVTELFNTLFLSDSLEHLKKTIPRFGHSLSADKRGSLWMFGGYSLSNGPLNDIRQFDTKNNTWVQVAVESTPDAKMPLGRYFHAAEIYLAKQSIYIYGGLSRTEKNKSARGQVLDDFWQFSIQNQRWDEIEFFTNDRPPPLAGHTLTFIKKHDRESLLLIGGISSDKVVNQLELWEFNLDATRWERLLALGVQMPVLYGHSAVYHATSNIVYVFGGYASGEIQNKLYALNLQKITWTELPVFKELNRPENNLPRGRYFHSAVTTENYMIVYGGRTKPYNASDVLVAYIYDCNQWVRLTEDVEILGKLPQYTFAEGVTIDQDNKAIYVVGGWDGSTQGQVIKVGLPDDICQFWSTGKYLCRHYMGCSFCSVVSEEDTSTFCFSEGNSDVCESTNGTLISNNGALCDDAWMSRRNCLTFTTCTACLASWPTHSESSPVCQWCDDCGIKGRCVPAGVDCDRPSTWCSKHTSVGLLNLCPQPQCHTLNCENCLSNDNCEWALNDVGITECITKELVEKNQYKVIGTCPPACSNFNNCSTCLTTERENPKDCRWSAMLNACISPRTQPLFCAGGVCGLVLNSNDIEYCPEPCDVYTQCSTCLKHAHCGWCSKDGENGEGVCTEGSLEVSLGNQSALTCELVYPTASNSSLMNLSGTLTWNYVQCPAENECSNGHHNCDPVSEKCVDSHFGYQCICAEGYRQENSSCVPVCSQGCVRGKCIQPNKCECFFGYVGANCSIQCQCNGHSDCEGPDKLDSCIKCHNNTMGAQCEKCQPLFVGNPKEGKNCVPCLEYCNGHTDVCVNAEFDPVVFNMTRADLEKILPQGPEANATCLRCSNFTDGSRCDTCITGFFRGTDDLHKECRPCQCHGHGNICDPVTGEKCNCANNTESDATCTAGGGKNSAQLCWMVQCSKCRDSYAGNPIDGHQCYKQITVESRMCFDAKPIEECKAKPLPLKPGQTVFFVIQPRFMNVDIRILIDVTQGELDVFMSPQDDSFIVENNETTGHHSVFLDNRYRWVSRSHLSYPLNIAQSKHENVTIKTMISEQKLFWTPHIHDCKSLGGTGFYVKDKHARELSTHVTLHQCNTLLRLFGLKNRLVLTLPQNSHNLSATRFFIALRASPGSDQSYGSIVFRQDQLHIDLFVFFSVFFSCFFLFLAICVVAWKAKQAADLRRARRRHIVEMLHMAKRPFACVFLTMCHDTESPMPLTRRGRIKVLSSSSSQSASPLIRLVAIEPTSDNYAAVGTVFVSLPGNQKAPNTLALGSSMILFPRQYPLNARNAQRNRRSSSQQQLPVN
ncbi:multiple epidermal growth factor-like domains protein 8 [Episyrphus balteatus]|uniref:multiple epidermal growth factor-like domains protein 8 n=1 Tax=Episyrphus balteatus TaxID=286459 RepID=UPI0024861B47|nr:multiple epidermal growth factor-like domains protein 8 [Episyrphus balteatus]